MRRILLALFVLMFTLPLPVEAKDFTSTGQVQVLPIRTTGEATVGSATLRFQASANVLIDFGTSTGLLFTYFGPRMETSTLNISLLGGTYLSPLGGMSALMSLWLEAPSFLNDKLYWLGEFDAYFPVPSKGDGEHKDKTYFIYSVLNYRLSDTMQLGVMTEQLFTADKHIQAAVGPLLSLGNFSFWPAYDFTPEDDDFDMFAMRVIYMP